MTNNNTYTNTNTTGQNKSQEAVAVSEDVIDLDDNDYSSNPYDNEE